MKKLIIALALLSASSVSYANASEEQEPENLGMSVLNVGRVTGICGILNRQLDFQYSMNVKGGDNFIQRFWIVESARWNLSSKRFQESCPLLIEKYNKYVVRFNGQAK